MLSKKQMQHCFHLRYQHSCSSRTLCSSLHLCLFRRCGYEKFHLSPPLIIGSIQSCLSLSIYTDKSRDPTQHWHAFHLFRTSSTHIRASITKSSFSLRNSQTSRQIWSIWEWISVKTFLSLKIETECTRIDLTRTFVYNWYRRNKLLPYVIATFTHINHRVCCYQYVRKGISLNFCVRLN